MNIVNLFDALGNLLADSSWEPIEPRVPCRRAGEMLHVDYAPAGVCEIDKPDDKVAAGFEQRVELNQSVPCLIMAGVESRSENLMFRRVFDYGLGLTLLDAEGETVATPFTPMAQPSRQWERAEVRIVPPRPAKTAVVRLVCLCQDGWGEFRKPQLVQLPAEKDWVSVDGVVMEAGTELKAGWYVLDVKDEKALVPAESAGELGLTISVRSRSSHAEARVTDESGADRALTVLYVHPLEPGEWRWLMNLRADTIAVSPGEYVFAANVQAGRGRLSRWPLAGVSSGAKGRAISLDLAQPAVFRMGYSAGVNALYIAFDIALTPEKQSARLAADTFDFDATWGFRGAIQRMYELQPEAFADRTGGHGLWVPFFESTGIEGHEDFGFRFKEGIGGDLAWGNKTGKLLTFHYVEPLTYWLKMGREMPRDMEHAMALIEKASADGQEDARAFRTSVYYRPSGRYAGIAVDAAWCDGIVWSMNSAPGIAEPNHFHTKFNARKLADYVEVDDPLKRVSGWYIDSIEGYITEDNDYRRDHFAGMVTPLSFDCQNHQPVAFTGLIVYEFTRRLAEELRSRGCMTMANTVPGRYCWLVPYLDVLGTETNWHHAGKWTPLSDEEMLYRRALTGDKPYCFLMNSDFSKFTHDMSERYMKRCVAYGMYPGYFSPNAFSDSYFGNPAWYGRDRELFKKYVPLCKLVGEAGWRPITKARSSDAKVYVERFGEDILTVFNDAGGEREVTIALDSDWPGSCVDRVSGEAVAVNSGEVRLTLGSEDVAVLAFGQSVLTTSLHGGTGPRGTG